MQKRVTACAATSTLLLTGIASAGLSGNYSNNFSNGGGYHYGSSYVSNYNGHSDLQLVSDGQPGTYGTWQTGAFDNQQITSFSASFKFSFKNGNGGAGDGFSFLFGDMNDMSGDRWQGGEYGLNAFNNDNNGMAIGFDSYGDGSGIHALSGAAEQGYTGFGDEWWQIPTYGDYNQALDDYWQGTIQVNWNIDTGLQVGIAWPGYDTWWGMDLGGFGSGMDTSNFGFGFAARNGGIDNDVLIDNFNIDYTYNELPAPGALALLGLGGLCARRRRRQS
jgi:hypothetical protein